ncbi:MAG: hypothetical protein SO369_08775 [Treponema sp.]|nr:hypothetical protein [Spirochaetia bacterium]MDY4675074.1 hypothetical protein [Treponema sp.]
MNLLDISKQVAEELFPDEIWIEVYKNVYIAHGRNPINREQEKVFKKELLMAKIASDNSHVVFLLPERKINKKNPDSVMDGFLTEFKNISGGENALSHRFREALRQGVNVYLKIDSEITVKRIRQILRGVLLQKENAGLVYCYLTHEKKMYCWKMIDLK